MPGSQGTLAERSGGSLTISGNAPKMTLRGAPVTADPARAVRMVLASKTGVATVVLQYAPHVTNMAGLAMQHTTMDRPNRQGLVTPTGDPLPEFSFKATLGYPDGETSVEGGLSAFESLADDGNPITITIGTVTIGGLWRITSLSWETSVRNARGEAAVATVDVTVTAAAEIEVTITPTSARSLEQPVVGTPPPDVPPDSLQNFVRLVQGVMKATGSGDFKAAYAGVLDAANPPVRNPTELESGTAQSVGTVWPSVGEAYQAIQALENQRRAKGQTSGR